MAQSTFGPASQPELAQISSEHVGWFAGLNAALFYADHGTSPPPRPRRLADWVRSLGGAGLEDQPAIAKLVELHDEMHERAERLLAGVTATGARPEEGAYLAFTRVYEEFAAQLGRVAAGHRREGRHADRAQVERGAVVDQRARLVGSHRQAGAGEQQAQAGRGRAAHRGHRRSPSPRVLIDRRRPRT